MEMLFSQMSPPSVIWVPCIPDYSKGSFVPIYNLSTIPSNISEKISVLPRGGIKSKPWKHEEDEALMELVKELGVKKWAQIASLLNQRFETGRKGKNCRERWNNHLDPNINKGEWSYEEDLKLIEKHQEFGKKWSKISRDIQGRTENAVKNRWNTLMKSFKQTVGGDNEVIATDYLYRHIKSCIDQQNNE